jgi:hypothetical protein
MSVKHMAIKSLGGGEKKGRVGEKYSGDHDGCKTKGTLDIFRQQIQ